MGRSKGLREGSETISRREAPLAAAPPIYATASPGRDCVERPLADYRVSSEPEAVRDVCRAPPVLRGLASIGERLVGGVFEAHDDLVVVDRDVVAPDTEAWMDEASAGRDVEVPLVPGAPDERGLGALGGCAVA